MLCFGPDRIQLHQSLADTVLNAAQGNTNFGLNRRASLRPYLRGAEGEIPSAYSPICFSAKPICAASAALREKFGETGVIVAAAVAGFVDTHSVAISIASLVASGKMNAVDAVIPILVGPRPTRSAG